MMNPLRLLRVLCVFAVPAVGLLAAPPAGAQGRQVAITEGPVLAVRGLTGDPLRRTFTVQVSGDPITAVQIVRHDLVDPATGAVILAGDLTIDPARVDRVADAQAFAVTVARPPRAGHFTGPLEVRYAEQPGLAALTAILDVTVEPLPAVAPDVNSAAVTFAVADGCCALPYLNEDGAGPPPGAPVLAARTVYLTQPGTDPAVVQSAQVLGLRSTSGAALPAGAVTVAAALPLTLTGGLAGALPLAVIGQNLPAGTYAGTLLVRVAHQPAPVQVALTVQVKQNGLWALLVLLAGLLIGILFTLWSGVGQPRLARARAIQALQGEIQAGLLLQKVEREAAADQLNRVAEVMGLGAPVERVDALLAAAQSAVHDAQAAAGRLLDETLAPLAAAAAALPYATAYKVALAARLTTLRQAVEGGLYDSLPAAQAAVAARAAEVDRVRALLAAAPTLGTDPALQATVAAAPDEAALTALLTVTARSFGLESAGAPSLPLAPEPQAARAALARFRLQRRWLLAGDTLVTLIALLFALVVGFVTIYGVSPTFGADPKEYVALFLWGAAVPVLGGQTPSLQAIYAKATQGGT